MALYECSFCGERSVDPVDEGMADAHKGCYLDYARSLADAHLDKELSKEALLAAEGAG